MLDDVSNNDKWLEATELWFYRRMLRIAWTEHASNVNVLRKAKAKRELVINIRKRQLKFLGHIMRKEDLEEIIVTGKIDGKRSRGRQGLMYASSLAKVMDMSV